MLVKPREYSGEDSWRSYRAHYERVASINGWTAAEMLDFLWINLTGIALSFVEGLSEEKQSSYDKLCVALDLRFGAERLAPIQKAELLSRKRMPGEPLAALGQAIRHLTRCAYPSFPMNVIEELAIERFLDALDEAELRMCIHQRSPTTLEDAIEHGIQIEAWRAADDRKHGKPRARVVIEEESETVRLVKDLRNRLEEMEMSNGRQGVICYNCGKRGHIARKCRAPNKNAGITCYSCGEKGHTSKQCQANTKMYDEKNRDANNSEYTVNSLANAFDSDKDNLKDDSVSTRQMDDNRRDTELARLGCDVCMVEQSRCKCGGLQCYPSSSHELPIECIRWGHDSGGGAFEHNGNTMRRMQCTSCGHKWNEICRHYVVEENRCTMNRVGHPLNPVQCRNGVHKCNESERYCDPPECEEGRCSLSSNKKCCSIGVITCNKSNHCYVGGCCEHNRANTDIRCVVCYSGREYTHVVARTRLTNDDDRCDKQIQVMHTRDKVCTKWDRESEHTQIKEPACRQVNKEVLEINNTCDLTGDCVKGEEYRKCTVNGERNIGVKEEHAIRETCEQRYRKINLSKDTMEMNVQVDILLGEDVVKAKLLLDTGAQRSFVSKKFYEKKLIDRADLQKCGVRMYGVGGQELNTTGEVELQIQLDKNVVRQKFIVADIEEEGILGFDFFKMHQAEWRWSDNELILGDVQGQIREVPPIGRIARVTTKDMVIVPPRSEIVTSGIIQGKVDIPKEGIIQPQGKFLEKYQLGVASVIGRKEGNSVPLRLINIQEKAVILPKNTQVGLYSPAVIIPERKVRQINEDSKETVDLESIFGKDLQELQEQDKEAFYALVRKYQAQFLFNKNNLGRTGLVQHEIHTGHHAPIKQQPRREPLGMKEVIKQEIEKMEKAGIIEPSNSPWASPVVLVRKKDGTVRFCVDYRKLNDVTEKDAYPLPRIEDNLDSLQGASWFSTLDLASGYWQVEMSEKDKSKTAFCTKYGLYQFNVMPFGLCNAPGTFERLMETVLRGMQWERAVLYLDDIIIFSKDIPQHLERIEEVLQRLKDANLTLKPSKCHFFKKQVEFLGHVVSQEGVQTDPKKIKDVKEWPIPRRVKDVRSFLGLTGYYRRFIKDYGSIAKPLHELTEKTTPFVWSKERQQAFHQLKSALTSAPILGYPSAEEGDEFILDTDASNCHIGAVLSQRQGTTERVIAYGSKVLSRQERNYCVTRRELLAVVHFVVHFRHYLLGRRFTLRSDHGALTWLFKFKQPEGQVARWLEQLSEFNFTIIHRPGRIHSNCDGLSRRPCPDSCKTCKRGEIPEEEQLEKVRNCGRTARIRQKTQQIRGTRQQVRTSEWMQEIKEAQAEDPVIKVISRWTAKPAWEDVCMKTREVKMLWSRWTQLKKEGDVWYYQWINQRGDEWKVLIPDTLRERVMTEHHNTKMGGHFGVMRTLEKLRSSPYYWPNMRTSVEEWVRQCNVCQRTKPEVKQERAVMGKLLATEPLERVAVDVMGPLPTTERGNRFIIVVGDYFTKWMEAYPCKDHKAETIAIALMEGFIGRFGIPHVIHTDQGRDFESKLFKELCKLLDIEKTHTTPWHPQSDGLVERFNRTLETLMRQTTRPDQSDWDIQVPICCMAYRAAIHETTRKTPNCMMLGRELPMPSHLLVATPENRTKQDVNTYVQNLERNMQKSHEAARDNSKRGQCWQKKQYDKRAQTKKLLAGTWVWLYNPTKRIGRSPKLQVKWEEEPYEIKRHLSDLVVELESVRSKKKRVVHRNQVKEVKKKPVEWVEEENKRETRKQDEKVEEEELLDLGYLVTGVRTRKTKVKVY